MKNFVFELTVKQFLLFKEWSSIQCDDLAKKISSYYFSKRSSEEILMNFIFIIIAIDEVRNKFVGRERQIGRVNMLTNLVGEYAAYLLADGPSMAKRVAAECAKAAPSGVDNYVSMKLKGLLMNLNHIERLFDYYDQNYSKIVNNVEIFSNKLSGEKQSVNQVFDELLQMRKYGVKPSAFQENILSAPNDYWIFQPSDYMIATYENVAGTVGWQLAKKGELVNQRIITSVAVSNKRNIDLSPVPFTLDSGEETYMLATDSKFDFGLNFKSELVIANGLADMNLRDIFANRGKGDLYEMLRTNAIFRLYDLVVPVYVEKAYSVPKFPERGILESLFPKNISFDPKLYLQRIRVLFDNLIHINKGLELEFEESIESKPSQLKREHNVVCHIRRLGTGYQPSEQARKLAREMLGYELKVGETFVIKHTRGKGEVKQDQLHLAVKKH